VTAVLNALTVDVEDYFQVSAFAKHISSSRWDSMESRVHQNTSRILDIFAEADVHATFFVLGWVAARFPKLVRRIHDAGHEIASHSFAHGLIYETTPNGFREDLRLARASIEDATGAAVSGFRAPSYSITRQSLWALDILIEEGYRYDSSIYPIRHDRYGIPDWPRHIHRIHRAGGALWELPGSTIRRAGLNLPVGGGGYFRLLPYGWTRSGIRRLNEVEKRPAIFYLHPWEIDPDQPRIGVPGLSRVRHYYNLDKTEARLRRLLADVRFGTVSDVLASIERSLRGTADAPARLGAIVVAPGTTSDDEWACMASSIEYLH
jgi:polysaccharide deacetylase family protein (PEP-CTERM system associated)